MDKRSNPEKTTLRKPEQFRRKQLWFRRIKVSKPFLICFALFAYSAAVMCISFVSKNFAESYSGTVTAFLNYVLSAATGWLPFSLAESVVIVLAFFLLFYIVWIVVSVIGKNIKPVFSSFRALLCTVLVLFSVFVNTFGVCYRRISLEDNLGIERKGITGSRLYECADDLRTSLAEKAITVDFDSSGASLDSHSWEQLNRAIDKGFDVLTGKYTFLSRSHSNAKKIALSNLMTYTHISGIYIPFTGEANVNTNYPDYIVAYSTAHEKAHQRGIAGEDEANFVAYLAMINSGDEYLMYSAQLNMYDYFLSAMLKTDIEGYRSLMSITDPKTLGEMYAYSRFFDKYRDSAASKVADSVNDTYLKAQGQNDGVRSYGLVVELMAAYMEKN